MPSSMELTEDSIVNHYPNVETEILKSHILPSNSNFPIIHINIRSFKHKLEQLELLLAELEVKFSCIVISETWFNASTHENSFSIDGYNLYCSSRSIGGGGGIAVYVSEKFEARIVDVSLEGCEGLLVHVSWSGRAVCSVLSVYRAPSGGVPAFLGDLEECLSSLPADSVVVGDLNIDINPDNELDSLSLKYMDILSKYGFYNIILTPTRFGDTKISLLDHVFINKATNNMQSFTINVDISDHLPIVAILDFSSSIKEAKVTSFSVINYNSLGNYVKEFNWKAIYSVSNASAAFDGFMDSIQLLIKNATQIRTISGTSKITKFKKPWMTMKLIDLIKKRTKMHNKSKKEPFNEKLKRDYHTFRNFVTNQIKFMKTNYYKAEYEKCKSNQNEKWLFIKRLLNKPSNKLNSPSILEEGGEIINNQLDIAESFNKYFTNIGVDLADMLPTTDVNFEIYLPKLNNLPTFKFDEIDSCDLFPIINSISIRKATGYDKISARAIKENSLVLTPVLVHIINLMIRTSEFPDPLKIARVTPIFKKGNPMHTNNYRPISILSILSKIIEKLLTNQIQTFMESHHLFTSSQFGFRKARNTTSAINILMEKLYAGYDNSVATQGVFLDFSKAFDTINHNILIAKLSHYNFSHESSMLLRSYLSNRKQYVKIGNTSSTFQPIKIGVPQGSVLGPLLFLIYINDLVKASPYLDYILFADDTNVFSTNQEVMRSELPKIVTWCLANKLILNSDKTLQVIFKAPNKKINTCEYELKINNSPLAFLDNTTFLGVVLDSNINFKKHISAVCSKLHLCLLIMRSVRRYLDDKMLTDFYYTFFYPHLIYGLEFWGHAGKTELNRILILQKAALRIIMKYKPNEHISSHFEKLKIMPIDMLFKYRFLILFLKTHSSDDIEKLKPAHNYETRSSGLKRIQVHNKRGERSLLSTGVALYNCYFAGMATGGLSAPWVGLASRLWASKV